MRSSSKTQNKFCPDCVGYRTDPPELGTPICHLDGKTCVVELASGEMIEAAMIGREGVVGGLAALDSKIAIRRAIVQMVGAASVVGADFVRHLAERSVDFRTTLIKHEQVLLAQSQQSAACNAAHTIEARLSRWLLRCRDSAGSEELSLTQELIAQMLGVRRTSVSIVANTLQQAGLIK
jgi:CRP-like cAMP-binding protein